MKKAFFLIFALVFSQGCANSLSSQQRESSLINDNAQQTFQNRNVNSGNADSVSVEIANMQPASVEDSAKIDAIKQKDQEEKARVPPIFRQIDFKNFTYPVNWKKKFVSLKDGIYEYQYPRFGGGEIFNFIDANYVELAKNEEKDAIVQLSRISCGGSCDGGSNLFYIYSIKKNKPKLIWKFETGSLAYGGGLKSFTVKNKKIIIEQFGENSIEMHKYHLKDTVRLSFSYRRGKFVKESKITISVPERNVGNYQSEINIENE